MKVKGSELALETDHFLLKALMKQILNIEMKYRVYDHLIFIFQSFFFFYFFLHLGICSDEMKDEVTLWRAG